jgi:FixJ family two-component response regulator
VRAWACDPLSPTLPCASGHHPNEREPACESMVFVVEQDASIRESIRRAIASAGWHVETFASGCEFLKRPREFVPNCVVLDAALRDTDSLDLQLRLSTDEPATSVIVMAHDPDISTAVRAMKAGAIEFFMKPLDHSALQAAVARALERSKSGHREAMELHALRQRYASLTPREKEVLALVVSGRLNKQVAGDLGISEITVKAHRGSATRKMRARSFANLVNMGVKIGLLAT